jgi:DNA mismatch repair protein MutS2
MTPAEAKAHYADWLAQFDAIEGDRIAKHIDQFLNSPRFTLLLDCRGADICAIDASLKSLGGQIYQNFDLLICGEAHILEALPQPTMMRVEYNKKLELTLKEADSLFHKIHEGEISKRKQLENKSFELTRELRKLDESKPAISNDDQKNIKPHEFKIGAKYFFPMLDRNVELKSMNEKRNEAQIMNGNITVRCKLDELFLPKGNKGSKATLPSVSIHIEKSENLSHHYDCRGMRLEEFENQIEKAISSLILGEIPFLNIVHGHGDGVLKAWLRKYLKSFNNLSYEIPEHSHDGATRINLKSN